MNDYPLILSIGHSATGGGRGKYIKLRKTKKKTLYAEGPKNFKEGIIYFEGKELGTIKVSKGMNYLDPRVRGSSL